MLVKVTKRFMGRFTVSKHRDKCADTAAEFEVDCQAEVPYASIRDLIESKKAISQQLLILLIVLFYCSFRLFASFFFECRSLM
jgi:hypothetical protein